MTPAQIRHIQESIQRDFGPYLDDSDIQNKSAGEQRQALLSRALTALALKNLSACDDQQASHGVIDGKDDNGIDGIFVDAESARLWVVQSKWSDKGSASLDQSSALKLRRGIDLLLNAEYSSFNYRFQFLADSVDAVLSMKGVRITVCVALMGTNPLSDLVQSDIDRHIDSLNMAYTMADFTLLRLPQFYQAILAEVADPRIDLDVLLEQWGQLNEPYLAYYGTVSTSDVAEWYSEHGDRLFAKNIRKSLGMTGANKALVTTLREQPEHFWYYNNGITVLCESIDKTARYGSRTSSGEFRIVGASVVNGAQTVAGIHEALRVHHTANNDGSVWVRFISLRDCPDGFAESITEATNTQNQVEARDFVAIDPIQTRLRDDFALSLSLTYVYKRGEADPMPSNGCSIAEAAVALAAAHTDPRYCGSAKQGGSALWDMSEKGAYKNLFRNEPSARTVWNAVLTLRSVRTILQGFQLKLEGRAAKIAEHGDLIVAHIVNHLYLPSRADGAYPTSPKENDIGTSLRWLIYRCDAEFSQYSNVSALFTNSNYCHTLATNVTDDIQSGREIPELSERYEQPRNERRTRRQNSVTVLVDANRIGIGTTLEFRPRTGPERKALLPWLSEDSARGRASWSNDRTSPLLWAADGQKYSPSGLVMHMMELATGRPLSAVQGTSRWFVPDEGSLVDMAESIRGGELDR